MTKNIKTFYKYQFMSIQITFYMLFALPITYGRGILIFFFDAGNYNTYTRLFLYHFKHSFVVDVVIIMHIIAIELFRIRKKKLNHSFSFIILGDTHTYKKYIKQLIGLPQKLVSINNNVIDWNV